jgi:hypothetical protein
MTGRILLFLKKKKQKDFSDWPRSPRGERGAINEVFLLLFVHKKKASFP